MKYINTGKLLTLFFLMFIGGVNAQDSLNVEINTAFQRVNKDDILGGVSSINISEILDKDYHINSLDNLSSFIPGFHGNIWGMDSYLVLVDGIPRDANNIMPSEIEQITVLKGVSALALYGNHAAKGAILITTKRGINSPNEIIVRANTGINVPKAFPEYLASAEYMTLYNEARANKKQDALYSEDEIELYDSGLNPYRYPDLDYYSEDYVRKFSNRTDVSTEFIGGNKVARFYTNMGFYHENSLLKVGEAKNDVTTRFNVRGNIDVKINEYISSKVNASMAFYDSKNAQGDYWSNAASLRPNRYSPFVPISYFDESNEEFAVLLENSKFLIDDKYLIGGNTFQQTTPFGEMYANGANTFSSRQYQFDVTVDYDMSPLLKGLSFSSQFGVDYSTNFNLSVNNNEYAVYEALWDTDEEGNEIITSVNKFNEDKVSRGRNLSDTWQRQTTFFSGQFNYANTFNNVHNVSALLLATGFQQTISGMYHKPSSANIGLNAVYNYSQKYYIDFTGNILHSAKLPEGNRQAISPTIALGWRISQEDFLANSNTINNLKITASAGILNSDLDLEDDYFLHSGFLTQRDGAWFSWQEGRSRTSTDIQRGENKNLTFIKRKEINIGFEAVLFNNSLFLNGTMFYNIMDGIPIVNTDLYPSYFSTGWPVSSFIPVDNFEQDLRKGFDFGASFKKNIGQVELNVGIVGTYYETEALRRSENYADEYQNRQGKPLDAIFGYKSDGFFMNESEIAESPTHGFGTVRPGDLRYIDQNDDGVIDERDTVYLGREGLYGQPLTMGLNFTVKWKNFTLFSLVNAGYGGYGMKNSEYYWVYDDRKYSALVRDRNIIGLNDNGEMEVTKLGTYPRLSIDGKGVSFRDSDFWLYKNDHINIARLQLSYDLPEKLFNNSFIKQCGIHLSGSNLLIISKEREILETNIGESPQNRFYNIGLKAVF